MKIYELKIYTKFSTEPYTLIYANRLSAEQKLNSARDMANFQEATLETLSNGGDDTKPFYTEDFEEF